ncbi:cyclophilin-like fold protein [Thermophilibacter sp.]
MHAITLTVNGREFAAALEATPAGEGLLARLPVTLSMDELNGNEKYAYLDEVLPADASCPGSIEAGDLMLFGSDCLVLFYQGFSTGYRYTRLGRVDDPTGLADACGRAAATVTWGLA